MSSAWKSLPEISEFFHEKTHTFLINTVFQNMKSDMAFKKSFLGTRFLFNNFIRPHIIKRHTNSSKRNVLDNFRTWVQSEVIQEVVKTHWPEC